MWKLYRVSFKLHLFISFIIRLALIVYSKFHDDISEVSYTDIDYKVFTDASRYILSNKSPYNRHTYRYTPLIAILLTPNIFVSPFFGKVLFSFCDILVGNLIRLIVLYNWKKYSSVKNRNRHSKKSIDEVVANFCMLLWIYNPISIVISTRGNCDSIAALFVLLTVYLLQCKEKIFLSGLIHGLAIHIRLYPLMYSLSYFMYLSKFGQYCINKRLTHTQIALKNSDQTVAQIDELKKPRKTIFKKDYLYYLVPNYVQLKFIFGTFLSLCCSIFVFYYLYGYEFIYETYLYHIIRKDTRHNFSVFFYLQYLTAGVKNAGIWQKVLTTLPQIVLLLVLSVRYGLNKFTLPFALLTETIVMVSYNSVLTSQYFIWILAVLPLSAWQFRINTKTSAVLICIWLLAQLAWLLPAYLLEFRGQNTFILIWLQSVGFFCANMTILGRLIKTYMYKID